MAFSDQAFSQHLRILANTFRMVQAVSCSIPLILLNVHTLLNVLAVEEEDKECLDIQVLDMHLDKGTLSKMNT